MAIKHRRLSATFVKRTKAAGKYGDGHGLFLLVEESGAARWVLRIQSGGRRRDIGLGSARLVSLAETRELAHEIRKKTKQGADPVALRRSGRVGVPTFELAARAVHAAHMKTWRNGKHTAQWLATLEAYAFPIIGHLPVNKIETSDIIKVLGPIWTEKAETARRVLQRLKIVLDHSTAAGHRTGENPCRIAAIGLPKQRTSVRHFTSLPYIKVPSFLKQLRSTQASNASKLAGTS